LLLHNFVNNEWVEAPSKGSVAVVNPATEEVDRRLPHASEISKTEIFGPVLGLLHLDSLDEVIEMINAGNYGNQACLFTSSGAAARKFRCEAEVGNLGINLGVAAPMAFFTQTKVVVERWPKEWSREF
jgi:malonate-semialdehyde dehydrogenase (acetylating)/methylmalonate-semialdehyde dehydrogenase